LFSVVVHGDSAGAEALRRSLSDWLTDMNLESAGALAEIDRYIGYYEPYATSHDALDKDSAVQDEVRNAAFVLAKAVLHRRNHPDPSEKTAVVEPRPK
jgi:hypothetical protein